MFFNKKAIVLLTVVTLAVFLTACGSKDNTDYETLREVSWEGTELTIKLGENQSSGCTWTTKPEDDSVIDYSINRSFKLSGDQTLKGKAIGTLSAGFEGKGAGTTQIVCTTPVGWDGTGDGLTYIVTVTVNEDGTIENAEGKASDAPPADESGEGDKTELTLEGYFSEHKDELDEIKKSMSEDETYKDIVDVDLKVKGNKLSYIYTFKQTYSADQVEQIKPDLEKSFDQVESDMKGKIKDIEEGYGVSGVKIYLEYRNGDGSKICGATIK